MSDLPLKRPPKNTDVKCLKCGAYNITDNRICGHCGANLPVVYDESGQVFRWEEAQGYEALTHKPQARKSGPSVGRTRWILRGMVLLMAMLVALYIMNAHK